MGVAKVLVAPVKPEPAAESVPVQPPVQTAAETNPDLEWIRGMDKRISEAYERAASVKIPDDFSWGIPEMPCPL